MQSTLGYVLIVFTQEPIFLDFHDTLTSEHDFIKSIIWTKTHHCHGCKRGLVELGPIEAMWLNWGR